MTDNPLDALGNLRYRSKEEVEFYLNVVENKAKPLEAFLSTRHIKEWRVIDEFPEYEISPDGTVRNRDTGVVRSTKNGRTVPDRLRVTVDGEVRTTAVRHLRNRAYPDLEQW